MFVSESESIEGHMVVYFIASVLLRTLLCLLNDIRGEEGERVTEDALLDTLRGQRFARMPDGTHVLCRKNRESQTHVTTLLNRVFDFKINKQKLTEYQVGQLVAKAGRRPAKEKTSKEQAD